MNMTMHTFEDQMIISEVYWKLARRNGVRFEHLIRTLHCSTHRDEDAMRRCMKRSGFGFSPIWAVAYGH